MLMLQVTHGVIDIATHVSLERQFLRGTVHAGTRPCFTAQLQKVTQVNTHEHAWSAASNRFFLNQSKCTTGGLPVFYTINQSQVLSVERRVR